jgi:hypothetical protein
VKLFAGIFTLIIISAATITTIPRRARKLREGIYRQLRCWVSELSVRNEHAPNGDSGNYSRAVALSPTEASVAAD